MQMVYNYYLSKLGIIFKQFIPLKGPKDDK